MDEGYFVEWTGEAWQSVFPEALAELSQLHATVEDAVDYMVVECGVDRSSIVVWI